jgi:hypothetical protein
MEAARCLRHLYIQQIQLLYISMGLNVDFDNIFEILFDYNDNDDIDIDDTSTITLDMPLNNK